jgi:nicotinic acid mononucleotide adenylyltransferase
MCLFFTYSNAQTNIKVMFYNLLNYPTAPPQNRSEILKRILNTYEPDFFMVCELESEQASNNILSYSLSDINKNYQKANFIINQSSSNEYSNLQQTIYYNSDYFTLINQTEILTDIRDINHYTFELNYLNQNINPIILEVFVTHLKASQGTENEQKRLEMVEQFTNYLNNISTNSYIIFAGDFNFYTSNETGYQKILNNTNNVIIKDVLNLNNNLQNWHTNYNYRQIHTQSTRTSNSEFNGYGSGGGLDDRFDFIFLSENILSTSDINYITNSYNSYGNNGNCYNKRIDDSSCNGIFDFNLRSDLYLMSDHLPVVLELESSNTLSLDNIIISQNFFETSNNVIYDIMKYKTSQNLIGNEVFIFNNIGQKINSFKISQQNDYINLSFLDKGIYYLKIENYNKILKFVKI